MSGPLRDLEASRERSALDPATAQPEKNPSTSTAKLAFARIQRSGAAPVAALRSLQRSRGNAFVQQAIQNIGRRGDAWEREADRAADRRSPGLASDRGHEPRIHDDADAAAKARALDARAFTIGRDIYFAAGTYEPHTNEGRRLLLHELTH